MSTKIAICLFDKKITDITASLMGGKSLLPISLNKGVVDAKLYLKPTNEIIPEWASIIQSFSSVKDTDVTTASSGAILFLKIKNRILACCFGTSVANIDKENIERDFGLAVAFNRIPNGNLKGMETFTLTENPITNNRMAARPSSQDTFNIDNYLETITQLSGKLTVNSRRILIKGKEFFSIRAPENFQDIQTLCTDLLTEYEKAIVNPRFKELTSVTKVKKAALLEYLNNDLCDLLNKKSQSIYLIDYEFNDELSSYSLTSSGVKFTELEIEDLYASPTKVSKLTLPYLKSRKISIYNSDDIEVNSWPLYKCLYTQLKLNTGTYILYKGVWYEVQERYLNGLKHSIEKHEIKPLTVGLPTWDEKKEEGDYNISVAKAIAGQCWDKALYTHPNFSYGIEFCDILLPQYIMHVKKLKSSSLNSHLLMQAYVSAQLLASDVAIRPWIKSESKKRFKKNIFLTAKNDFKSPSVKYLIVLMRGMMKKPLVDTLPFFSLITFNFIIGRIRLLGFEVEVCAV